MSPSTQTSQTNASVTFAWRRDVQGLRALAVVLVVAFPAGLPVPGGFIGVDVFYVISGFVITGMLSNEWERAGTISLAAFYLRRFKRLTPALVGMLVLVTLMSVVIVSPLGTQQVMAQMALGSLFLWPMLLRSGLPGVTSMFPRSSTRYCTPGHCQWRSSSTCFTPLCWCWVGMPPGGSVLRSGSPLYW